MEIIRANISHLDLLTPLFDAYRVFYKKPSDMEGARKFLKDRIESDESIIFLALADNGIPLGFTQLYPSYSSVSMQAVFILNDLYVVEQARGTGVGSALLEYAKEFARANGSRGLTLETAIDNPAQKLYERLGWKKDTDVFHYTWQV